MSKKRRHHEPEAEAAWEELAERQARADAESDATPDELAAVTGERDDLLGRLQRLAADYQNYQKRVQKDVAAARDYANESLLKELLPVLDDMENALAAAAENHAPDDPMLTGMQLVYDKLMGVLKRFGLEPIDATGQAFDPETHSAMMQQPSADVEPMTVLQQIQKGYTLKGRTLRPAAVVVATAPTEEED